VLAAMANYIDSGSIVAGAVAVPIWTTQFGFGSNFVSLLGAFSSNAISAGLGAVIGGRICDRLGRKKIYQWDLLLYAFGALWIIFAQQAWMLLTESAPTNSRGRVAGLAQVLWYAGTIVPLVLGIALLGLNHLMPRILFGQLFVVAVITWALRQSLVESELWTQAQEQAAARPVRSVSSSPGAMCARWSS
jgi:MFS transporter, SP family, inositol transporter